MNRLTNSSGGNKECKSELFFTHSDHLGSSSWTTDANGRAIQHIEYLPFGEELVNQRTTSYSERYTFTGKELDAESNLYYYDARYNSSTYSQFTAVDPMSDKYPAVNPYLYCAGNPVIYVDPDGTHPLFDTGGNFLGVDDEGFQGKAIIMNKDDFPEDPAVLLTSENALKLSKGYQSLSTNEAKRNLLTLGGLANAGFFGSPYNILFYGHQK